MRVLEIRNRRQNLLTRVKIARQIVTIDRRFIVLKPVTYSYQHQKIAPSVDVLSDYRSIQMHQF